MPLLYEELSMKIDKIKTNFEIAKIAFRIFNSPTCQNAKKCENCKGKAVCECLNKLLEFVDEA